MTHQLRDYQTGAIEAVWNHLGTHDGNCIGVLPTGTGKSLVIAEFIRRALTEYPGTRILVVQHVRELIQQNMAELLRHFPEAPIGVYSAGMGRKDTRAQVLFASIQSIHKKAFQFQDPPFDLVLVDECQLIPRTANTTYRKFLADLKQINPYVRVVGWTATAFRTDSGMLHKGDDAIFQSIAYEYNIRDAIAAGYLCPPVSTSSSVQIDTSHVGTRLGEFAAGQLEAAATDPETVNAIADEIVKHGVDRRGWLFFGCGITHCTMMRDALRERGITAECVFGDTPTAERDRIIAAYKRQEIRCLCAMNVLLIGFNAPHSDLLAMGRPTQSAGLWVQAVGRILRLSPGKIDGLVLCFGGNIARFGPVDAITIKDKKKSDVPGEMPEKICPECESPNPISARECIECGFEFPPVVTKIDTKASTGAMLTTQMIPAAAEWVDVDKVTYRLNPGKADKPDTMRVDYFCGLARHSEFICIEHSGYPRQKANQWWNRRNRYDCGLPDVVKDALKRTDELIVPSQIQVKPNGKYTEIVAARFM